MEPTKPKYSFGVTSKDLVVLAVDGKAVTEVKKIKGYDWLLRDLVDTTVNKMNPIDKTILTLPKKEEVVIKKERKDVNNVKYIVNYLATFTSLIMWLAGIVISKGGWSVTFSILFFPYAWYLFVERILSIMHIV